MNQVDPRQLTIIASTLLGFSSLSYAYSVDTVATGLKVPWSIEFMDPDTALISERNGSIVQLNLSNSEIKKLYKPDNVYSSGQGGLLDLAIHPTDKSQIYLTYSQRSPKGAHTVLASATYRDNTITNFKDIVLTQSYSSTGRHFGSRIVFDDNNDLYFSVGDRGDRDNGQDLSTHASTILRVNTNGSAPSDNPFVNKKGALPEIWSYGHRNPQGMTYDHATKTLWAIEHGPRGGDEINKIEKGHNYGWPVTSHGKEYWGPFDVGESEHKQGITSPSLVYIPSIAPAGMTIYRGERYPELNGKLLAGALKLTHINVVNVDGDNLTEERRLFEELGERIRDITVSPDDFIYFTTDSGKVYRIVPQ